FEFVGFDNYLAIFRYPLFIKTYTNVLIIMAGTIPITMLLAIYFAVLLNSALLKGKGFFRTVYYFPTITSTVAVASLF
ncbi:sugar ABC transporter permease, partial [Enterococcus faecium]